MRQVEPGSGVERSVSTLKLFPTFPLTSVDLLLLFSTSPLGPHLAGSWLRVELVLPVSFTLCRSWQRSEWSLAVRQWSYFPRHRHRHYGASSGTAMIDTIVLPLSIISHCLATRLKDGGLWSVHCPLSFPLPLLRYRSPTITATGSRKRAQACISSCGIELHSPTFSDRASRVNFNPPLRRPGSISGWAGVCRPGDADGHPGPVDRMEEDVGRDVGFMKTRWWTCGSMGWLEHITTRSHHLAPVCA